MAESLSNNNNFPSFKKRIHILNHFIQKGPDDIISVPLDGIQCTKHTDRFVPNGTAQNQATVSSVQARTLPLTTTNIKKRKLLTLKHRKCFCCSFWESGSHYRVDLAGLLEQSEPAALQAAGGRPVRVQPVGPGGVE